MVNLTSSGHGLLGALVFARHADRIESFSSPTTYATFDTFITPLGTVRSLVRLLSLGSFSFAEPGISVRDLSPVDLSQSVVPIVHYWYKQGYCEHPRDSGPSGLFRRRNRLPTVRQRSYTRTFPPDERL
jgi:hypothetical protein